MQEKITKCLGLTTQYNPLTIAPGALAKANDVMVRRENIIEPRRGHNLYATMATAPSQYFAYLSRVIIHQGTTLSYDNGSGTFAGYSGSYSAPTSSRIRGVEAFGNFYLTASDGIRKLVDVAGTAAARAGVARCLDPSYTLTGASGFLANSYQCAYRAVLQRIDANSVTVTGYPSQRLWVINAAGGSRNVILTVYLPSSIVAGDILQMYRTAQFSGTSTDTSGEEMGIVYQVSITSTDISNGYVSFTDSVTDALIGASLYTSPSQQGIAQANAEPPLAKDVALYKSNFMLYANTQTKQRLYVTLVGTSGLSGKTITLGGVTYNFGASEIVSGGGSPQALVSATGVAAVDIDLTARSLVRVINRYASNTTVYAYYLSGPDDLPGQIMIEEKSVGGAAFTIQASDTTIGGMFYPIPPVSPSTTTASTSTNEVRKNALYFSKSQEPEHVPLLNYVLVGPSNKEILRVFALRDSTIIIKEEGVYRLTGDTPQSFVVTLLDNTVFCKAANSAVVLANQVFMLSNQGVVAISESGVQVVSREIEPSLTPLYQISSLASYVFGMSYDSERSYFLSVPTTSSDTVQNQTFVYNIFTRAWVRHSYAMTCGIVEPSADKMYFSKPSDVIAYAERKTFTDSDFADADISITISAISGRTVTFTISSYTPLVGWVIAQGSTEIAIESIVTAGGGYTATLLEAPPSTWTTGAATIYKPVGFDIEWHSWTGQNNPDLLKQVREVAILADDIQGQNTVRALTCVFKSNFDNEATEVAMVRGATGWGDAWGSSSWGGDSDSWGYPTYVPRNKQYCTRLKLGVKHQNAREKLSIAGCAFSFRAVSDRVGR